MKISEIQIKIILDSRGQPTLQGILTASHGVFEASVPAGKSTGAHEAAVIDPETANGKLSVIKERLLASNCKNIAEFDLLLKELDGTENKSRLGGNLMLALSMAWVRARAVEEKKELHQFLKEELLTRNAKIPNSIPHPIFNVINGGAHAALKSLDFQEFQVVPTTDDYPLALSIGAEYYRKLKAVLVKKFGEDKVALGDEAGFSCPFSSNEEALEIMAELIEKQKYPLTIGLDAAATQFYKDGAYMVDENPLTTEDLMQLYEKLIHVYPIVSIEDPFQEEDFESFAKLMTRINADIHADTRGSISENQRPDQRKSATLVITDDLTTTNPKRLQTAIDKKSGNAILVKPNQIGTISETLDVITQAYANGWHAVVSHRSGETMDDFIADLAIAAGAWGIKAGAPGRPERIAKYSRILEIVQNEW